LIGHVVVRMSIVAAGEKCALASRFGIRRWAFESSANHRR
jgi:hypothetical protein